MKAGAKSVMLGRNGWLAYSRVESVNLANLRGASAALNIECDGLMAVGPERYKMIGDGEK